MWPGVHLQHQATKTHQLQQNFLKIAGKSWRIKLRHRTVLYKTVIERMLVHVAGVWCLHLRSELQDSYHPLKEASCWPSQGLIEHVAWCSFTTPGHKNASTAAKLPENSGKILGN
ncbi:hypothetical protein AVEN_175173-1 [Araneus ventricosus]|uniref:Uncharacterized protein n=1 Tax=Araneus ventricosus TaxID=182803 RepID=A0A4Y2PXQ5_ARAVE|nr:hypothetical protein AVEN_175173-1 [Araneus ventricosus]